MQKNKKIIIKLGTNFILNNKIKKIVKSISKIKKNNFDVVIVSSGAVKFGKNEFEDKYIKEDVKILENKDYSSIGQIILMNKYYEDFKTYKNIISQILITNKINSGVITSLLKNNIIPIVNGNDAEKEEDLIFNDNDSLAGEVSMEIKAELLIILSDVDGVYDSNPKTNKKAKKFKILQEIENNLLDRSTEIGTEMGTGGMYTKLITAKKLLKNNIKTYITDSLEDVEDFLLDEEYNFKGTLIEGKKENIK